MRLQAISRFYHTKYEIRLNCRNPYFIHFMEIKILSFFHSSFFI